MRQKEAQRAEWSDQTRAWGTRGALAALGRQSEICSEICRDLFSTDVLGTEFPGLGKKNQIAFFLWCRVMGLDGREGSYLQKEKVTGFHLRLVMWTGS